MNCTKRVSPRFSDEELAEYAELNHVDYQELRQKFPIELEVRHPLAIPTLLLVCGFICGAIWYWIR